MNNTPRYSLQRPVFFVGFMGAGKTSVARRLARLCGVASVDTDTYLERYTGKAIKEIFAEEGEDKFRTYETATLHELAEKPEPMLISCGGGIVVREENRTILSTAGFVIHLKVSADEAAQRIHNTESRPLFENIDAARARANEREKLYKLVADATIETAGKTVSQIAHEVQHTLKKKGILCPQQK